MATEKKNKPKSIPKPLRTPALAAPYELANDLYNLITNNKPLSDSVNTLYDELMSKEKKVLDTIQQVVEDKAAERKKKTSFLETPISRIPLDLIRSMTGLLATWTKSPPTSYDDVINIMAIDHRMIYTGILLVIIALFLIFIQISNGPLVA
jgi:hypothetical protein